MHWLRAIVLGFFLYQLFVLLSGAGVKLIDRDVHQLQVALTWSNYMLIFLEHGLPAFITTWMMCHYVPAPRAVAAWVFSLLVLIILAFYGQFKQLILSGEGLQSYVIFNPEVVGILAGTAANMIIFSRMSEDERKRYFPENQDTLDGMDFNTHEERIEE